MFADLFIKGLIAHLIADWLLQNDWIARNKVSQPFPWHISLWLHGIIHTWGAWAVFPWYVALALGFIHMLVDTRKPLAWWQRVYSQTTEGPYAIPGSIWTDQVIHIVCIAIAAYAMAA